MRPMIVGEAPSRTSDPSTPLSGRCGAALAAMCGLSVAEFRARFDLANLLDRWPGAGDSKGARFDRPLAIDAAQTIVKRTKPGQVIVVLGRRAASAFGYARGYFEAHRLVSGGVLYVVPHPSGVNRWYNESENRERMARFMRNLVEGDAL